MYRKYESIYVFIAGHTSYHLAIAHQISCYFPHDDNEIRTESDERVSRVVWAHNGILSMKLSAGL